MTRTPEEHCRVLFNVMKFNSTRRGHDKPECETHQDFYKECINRCVGKKLVTITLKDGTTTFKVGFNKTSDGFFLPVAFTNGLFFSLSPERIDEHGKQGYRNNNWIMFPICFNGGIQFSSVSALLAKALKKRTRQDVADLLDKIFTSDKRNGKYATSTGAKLRSLLTDAVQHTKKRQENNHHTDMKDVYFVFKQLVVKLCKQGFRCICTGAILILLGAGDNNATMISLDRNNSVTDHYTPLLTRLVCACFNTCMEGGESGNALGATLTKMNCAYWKFIVGDDNWAKIEPNVATDAKNAMDLFETKYNDKYDDKGYVNHVTPYFAMVADNGNKVCSWRKAGRFFDKDKIGERKCFVAYDDTHNKNFKSFVDGINSQEKQYKRQRKELCSQSPTVKAYFVAANKKYAAKHPNEPQPRFDII
jgi:hypothetical protein